MTDISIRMRNELAREFIDLKEKTGLNKNTHLMRKLIDTYKVYSPHYRWKMEEQPGK